MRLAPGYHAKLNYTEGFRPPVFNNTDSNGESIQIDLTPGSERRSQRAFLDRLAFDTGGLYSDGFGGFEDALDRVSDSNSLYYLLSYQTEHSAGEIGYQRVTVRTKNPSLQVLARTGYRYGR